MQDFSKLKMPSLFTLTCEIHGLVLDEQGCSICSGRTTVEEENNWKFHKSDNEETTNSQSGNINKSR